MFRSIALSIILSLTTSSVVYASAVTEKTEQAFDKIIPIVSAPSVTSAMALSCATRGDRSRVADKRYCEARNITIVFLVWSAISYASPGAGASTLMSALAMNELVDQLIEVGGEAEAHKILVESQAYYATGELTPYLETLANLYRKFDFDKKPDDDQAIVGNLVNLADFVLQGK